MIKALPILQIQSPFTSFPALTKALAQAKPLFAFLLFFVDNSLSPLRGSTPDFP
jgi:hypothetical protein